MILKKIDINFINVKYGWLPFNITLNKKVAIKISASGVYNPFYEYVDILYDLKYNRRKNIIFYIDQEGFDAKITIKNLNKNILISFETEKDKLSKYDLPFTKAYVSKKQFIETFSQKLSNFYFKNKKEMDNEFYNFSFNKGKLRKVIFS